jgi:hypothetical protein
MKIAPALLRFANDAEMPHHTQIIAPLPLLNYIISFYAVYGDAFELYPLLGRDYPNQLTLTSTAYGPAGYDLGCVSSRQGVNQIAMNFG